jgi:hypothetical protein
MTEPGTTHPHHEEGPHPSHSHDYRLTGYGPIVTGASWVAVFFIAAALFVYITSVDLSLVPSRHHHRPETVPAGQ